MDGCLRRLEGRAEDRGAAFVVSADLGARQDEGAKYSWPIPIVAPG